MIRSAIPRDASLLGYAGVLPFAVLAFSQVFRLDFPGQDPLTAFVVYGGIILSFLGGIRWGSAVASGGSRPIGLWLSILPSLWAVVLLWWTDPATAAWGMFAGFVLLGLADALLTIPGFPSWMRRLRLRLTVAVAVCHLPVLLVLLFFGRT